jgi:hypothetical protein
MIKLTKQQQDLLKSVGRKPKHPDMGLSNEPLDNLVEQLKMENPNAFLKDYELRDRVFYNEPMNSIPFKGYVISALETMKG